jgi:hypothetical protein
MHGLEALGFKPLIAGFIGSILSLKWVPEAVTTRAKVWTVLAAFSCSLFLPPMMWEWFEITKVGTQTGISFVVGLFGMAAAGKVYAAIMDLPLTDFIKRKFGGV